jgi:5-(aminomethyl)-3-furanmethanol phosphate kinase
VSALTVIKLGGSLADSDAAAALVRSLPARRLGRLIVVPGGGEFAETVRVAQRRHAFAERAAHHMALLAMHQYAIMLAALAPCFVVAESPPEFESAWQRELTPVWAPERMALAATDLPASWDITSDSLAAWLAVRTGAARLVVVKSCEVPEEMRSNAVALAAAGLVDPCFPTYVSGATFSWQVVSGVTAALRELEA